MIIEVKDLRNLKSYGDLNVDVKLFLIIIFNKEIKMEKERIKKYYKDYLKINSLNGLDFKTFSDLEKLIAFGVLNLYSVANEKNEIQKNAKLIFNMKQELIDLGLWKYINEGILKSNLD